MGICTRRRCFFSSVFKNFMSSSVRSGPGHNAFTRIFSRACMTASSRVSASTAPLLAVYATCGVAAPRIATNDAVLIIEPPPARCNAGIPYLQPRKTPFALTFIVRSQIASSVVTALSSSLCMMPALLKIMFNFPNFSSAKATAASQSAALDTSECRK
ncbi:hypothetical protein D3C87_1753150 [compost metagenome]